MKPLIWPLVTRLQLPLEAEVTFDSCYLSLGCCPNCLSTYFCRNSASVSCGEGTPPVLPVTCDLSPGNLGAARSRGGPEARLRPLSWLRGPPLTPHTSSPSVSESVPLLWLDQLKSKKCHESSCRSCTFLVHDDSSRVFRGDQMIQNRNVNDDWGG